MGAAPAPAAARQGGPAGRCPRESHCGGDQDLTSPTTSPAPSPRRSRARRGEGERLRAEILEAATRLLFEAGEAAVSIRAVADAVGVTPPSIYLHFADKTELLWEVCEEQFRKLEEQLAAATASAEDPVEALERCGRAYVDFGLSNAEGYRILFMGRTHQVPGVVDPGEERPAAFAHVVEAVRRGIDAGRLRDGSAEMLALGLWAAAHGITSLLIALPDFPWPGERDAMIDHLLAQAIEGVLRRG